jgi:hypothetical protein
MYISNTAFTLALTEKMSVTRRAGHLVRLPRAAEDKGRQNWIQNR